MLSLPIGGTRDPYGQCLVKVKVCVCMCVYVCVCVCVHVCVFILGWYSLGSLADKTCTTSYEGD